MVGHDDKPSGLPSAEGQSLAALLPPTFKLARGSHNGPIEGMCIMELVSFMAGEPFSDKPDCADPVIATLLVHLNDSVPDDDRQRLLPFYSRVLGSRGTGADSDRRSQIVVRHAAAAAERRVTIFESVFPSDNRLRTAIAAAKKRQLGWVSASETIGLATEVSSAEFNNALLVLDEMLNAGPQGVGYEKIDVPARVAEYLELVRAQ